MKRIFFNLKTVLLLSVLLSSVLVLKAQDKVPVYSPTDVVGFQIQVMQERLGLNQEQMNQLIEWNKKDAIRAKKLTTEEAKKVRNEREAKYKQILTSSQYAKWDAQRDDINKEAQFRYLTSDAYAKEFTKVIESESAEPQKSDE